MRLPRNISGQHLASSLRTMGYLPTRQKGGHLRLTTHQNGEHHVTVPLHESLRVGTLANILSDVQTHFSLSRDELLERIGL